MKPTAYASLEKALDILDLFDLNRSAITTQEIAEHLSIPLSTTYKYVDILQKRGLLARKTGSKEIRLGLMAFRLGNIFTAGFDLIDVAIPHMKDLLNQSGETILLTAIQGWEAVCLDEMEPQRLIKMSFERGRTLPLHAGASSRILLAYQGDEFIDDYVREFGLQGMTKHTITTLAKLKSELKLTRKNGYTTSDSEVDDGAKAIAAPIFDHVGRVLAGLTVSGPSERINSHNMKQLINMVQDSAHRISSGLSYTTAN